MKPSQILARLCKDEGLDGPTYTAPGKCKIENRIFSASANITDEAGRHLAFRLCFLASCKKTLSSNCFLKSKFRKEMN